MDIGFSPRERDDCIDEQLSWSKPIWEEVSCDHPTSGPRINHQGAPANRPRHSPRPAPNPTHTTPSHLLESLLRGGTNAHEKEESAHSAKFYSSSKPPYPGVVN